MTCPPHFPAWRFALSWHRTELREVLSHRLTYRDHGHIGWRRPALAATILGASTLYAAIGQNFAHLLGHGAPGQVVGAVVGFVSCLLLCGAILASLTAMTARRAEGRVWHEDERGCSGVIAKAQRDGTWLACYLHARPTGRGLGSEAFRELLDQADEAGAEVRLVASHPDAARLYETLGFVADEPGSMKMKRPLENLSN